MLCWASRPLCNTFVPSQDLASMSQPFPYPPSFSSLYLLLVVLLQVLLLSEAYSGGPRDPGLRMRGCTTLSVGHHGNKLHSNTTHAEQTRTPKVEARLLDGFTHNPVDCYTPGAKHLVQLGVHGTNHKIKGLVISSRKTCGRLGLESDTLGKFKRKSPLRWWLGCPNTITQSRVLGGGTGVTEVSVPWQAPSMSSQTVTFVYSVVFSYDEWLERLHRTYPSCVPPCVAVAQDNSTNSSAAAGNTTCDDGWQPVPDECRRSHANEKLVRCGALSSFPKKCSVALGSLVYPIRKFTRYPHPSSTLNCTRIDCNC